MRNDESFPAKGLLSAELAPQALPRPPLYPSELAYIFALKDQSPEVRHVLLSTVLETLKQDRASFKASGRIAPVVEKALINTTLSVAREINSLRQQNSDLLTLVNQPDRYMSALTGVLKDLKSEQVSRTSQGAPTALLTKVTKNISHTITDLKETTMIADVFPRPEGKPPPQNFLSRLIKGAAAVAFAAHVLPASAPEAPQKSSQALPAPAAAVIIRSAPQLVSAEAQPKKTSRRYHAEKDVSVPSGMLKTLPHVTVTAKRIVEVKPRIQAAAKESVKKWNPDKLFEKPYILVPALKALQNMPVEVAFRKAVLVESGGRQFDSKGAPLKSSKGATGVSQVMPETAEKIAPKCTGKPLDNERFHNDTNYNHALGECYYKARTAAYGGNPVMGALDYNLGPVKMQAHIAKVGDPTKGETTMVDFIETLPIKETRHYALQMLKQAKLVNPADLEDKPPVVKSPSGEIPEIGHAFVHAGAAAAGEDSITTVQSQPVSERHLELR